MKQRKSRGGDESRSRDDEDRAPPEDDDVPRYGQPVRRRPPKKGLSGFAIAGFVALAAVGFLSVVGGLAVGFAAVGREAPQAPTVKWAVGQTVDVEITLVKRDRVELDCAAADEVAGRHCAFEAASTPWSKGGGGDDRKLLKPYTTTDRLQFLAAGVWSQPILAEGSLPASRFTLACKLLIEGKLEHVSVRWESSGSWFPVNTWFTGSVSDCKMVR